MQQNIFLVNSSLELNSDLNNACMASINEGAILDNTSHSLIKLRETKG